MEAFQGAGVQVGITELTVRLNPHLANGKSYPYSDILTPTQVVSQMAINTHANRYRDLIKIYKDFDKAYPGSLTGISIWGLFDRPDMEIEKTKPIDVPVAEGGRHYDYDVYGTHSGLFVGDFNKNYDDFKIKQAFTNVITELKK